MTPDGTSLYITAGATGHGVVLQYDVAASGAATPKAIPSVSAGKKPTAIAIDPAGKTLYVGDQGTDNLLQFHIGPGGALEPLETRDARRAADRAHRGPRRRARLHDRRQASSSGWTSARTGASTRRRSSGTARARSSRTSSSHRTAVTCTRRASPTGILGFEVAADGSITALAPGHDRDRREGHVARDLRGRQQPVRRGAAGPPSGNRLLQYTIEDDGALTAKDPASQPLGAGPHDLAITPDGRSLYVAAGDLALFDLDASGVATPKTPAAVDLVEANGVVVSPNQAPVASFEAVGAPAGSAVVFNAAGASDPDGSITRYDWDFGDGNTLQNGGPQVAHVFAQPGSYEVRLVVTDNEGASTLTTFTGTSVLGNGSPAAATSRVIQIAAPDLPLPPPIGPAQPPRPELGETVIVEPAGGRVLVRLPGEENFVNLRTLQVIPDRLAHRRASRQDAPQQRPRPRRQRPAGPLLPGPVPGPPAPLRALPDGARAARQDRPLPARNARERGGAIVAAPLGQRQRPLPDPRALLVGSRARHALARRRHLQGDADGGAARARRGTRFHPGPDDGPREG